MKKILGSITLICFLLTQVHFANALGLESLQSSVSESSENTDVFASDLETAQANIIALFGETTGKKYIAAVDKLVNNQKSISVIETLKNRLEPRIDKLRFGDRDFTQKEKMVYTIGTYLLLKMSQKIALAQVEQVTGSGETLSEKEIQSVEDTLTTMEFNIVQPLSKNILSLLENVTKGTRTTGNISMSLKAEDESLGFLESVLKLKDFNSQSKDFDSSFKGNIDFMLHALEAGNTGSIDIQVNTLVDLITKKGGDIYISVNNLQTKYSKDPLIEGVMKKVQQIADLGKYIKISGQSTDESISQLNDVLLFLNNNLNKKTYTPLLGFTPYKKIGKKYFLKQTGKNCEKLKDTYAFMADIHCIEDEMSQSNLVELTLDMTDPSKNIFTMDSLQGDGKIKFQVFFNAEKTIQVTLSGGEYTTDATHEVYISYVNGNALTVSLKDPVGEASFYSNLDSKNTFTSIDSKINVPDTINSTLTLKDHAIQGGLSLYSPTYNWETNLMDSKKILEASLSGTTDTSNTLSTLKVLGTGNALASDGDILNITFNYANKTADGKITYDNPPLFGGLMSVHYGFTGDIPKNYGVNEEIHLELNKLGKKIIDFSLKADAQELQTNDVQIKTPSDFIKMEDIQFENGTESLLP